MNATVVGEVKLTVGAIGSAIDNSITSLAVLPEAGIVAPSGYLPKVLPSDKETVRSSSKVASVPDMEITLVDGSYVTVVKPNPVNVTVSPLAIVLLSPVTLTFQSKPVGSLPSPEI